MFKKSFFTHLNCRSVLRIGGKDAFKFLQGLTTNDLNLLKSAKQPLYNGFLTHKGRVLTDATIVKDTIENEDFFFIDCASASEPSLSKHLKKYRLRSKVQIENVSDSYRVWSFMPAFDFFSEENELLKESILEMNSKPNGGAAFQDPRSQLFGGRAILPSIITPSMPTSFVKTNSSSYNTRRMLLGALEGEELLETIPMECNIDLLNGICFSKGCYVGQELTARTQFKGNIRKRVVPVVFLPRATEDKVIQPMSFTPLDLLIKNYNKTNDLFDSGNVPDIDSNVYKNGVKAKRIGKILATSKEMRIGLAQIRLEHLLGDSAKEIDFYSDNEQFTVLPIRPSWWPHLDIKTGKPSE